MSPTFYALTSKNGYNLGEVASAFQKSVRRGLEEDALYWGIELDISGYGEYAWKRMRIMMSEDIGLAEPLLPAQIYSLYECWLMQKKKKDERHGPERLFFVHAILLLSRARKSRIVDHALIVSYGNHTKREIPDYALDKHTMRGRKMGRGIKHFFDEGIKLNNQSKDFNDTYFHQARETMLRNGGDQEEMGFDE